MCHRKGLAAAIVVLIVATACGTRGDQAGELRAQSTVTVTVTASPDADDPCADPPSGTDLIFVVQPSPGERVTSPFTVTGCSSTFEANVVWELLDADGGTLADGSTMGGTMGQPGRFSFDVEFDVTGEEIATLRVYESSAEDGSEMHVNSLPIVLQP
ncbi:MAG: Gmad2 immunoglobulin-like domain-containing protein [Actinomycetota bacterium]|nr:Gmad2 immunoglobulin-like domain-containing protein [Actinomycetota bacterium]